MQQLDCDTCGNRVLVEKFSECHTSVQWIDDAGSRCPEFRARADRGQSSMFVTSCAALSDSIWNAFRDGRLTESSREIGSVPLDGTVLSQPMSESSQ
ncbi:hypothetical protein G4X40_15905 [Rhodococcus sp. D2-41]|uniref:Ferredoxin n=1 Tax=Speluncibacter jeojiensis TaxID=2710754 RepID=A0A9X4M1E0_9ACTN|nr:hypothetical protein [Rhodococcus sp. D2-41]MDG3011628.1 hypothetical protein [Rhodococcus sp. D2-41]MDG3015017.1 hypothetical protein [Corynebacteriales bacterium D3-21]